MADEEKTPPPKRTTADLIVALLVTQAALIHTLRATGQLDMDRFEKSLDEYGDSILSEGATRIIASFRRKKSVSPDVKPE